MSIFHNNSLIGSSGQGGYTISRSLRFNSPDSAYLSRTPASAGNRKTWTWAGWVKKVKNESILPLYNGRQSSSDFTNLWFDSGDGLFIRSRTGGSDALYAYTSAVFRDPSAWYHVVVAVDTTQATAANGLKVYVNGVQQTLTIPTYSQNSDTWVNSTQQQRIGYLINQNSSTYYLDSYLADIHFIDGQALTPTSFGEFSATTGVWMPKAYTGTYGTNGFRLDFSDNSAATATTLGKDAAGSNNWTPNNISVISSAGNYAAYVYESNSIYNGSATGTSYYTGAGSQFNGFDGNTSTVVGGGNFAQSWVYFRPSPSLTSVTQLRVFAGYVAEIRVNGSTATLSPSASTADQWYSIVSPPSTVTEIAVQGTSFGSAAARFAAIEVNGAVLIDNIFTANNDSLVDVPVNGSEVDTGLGGQVRGNYATLNPLSNAYTLSNGNLDVSSNVDSNYVPATIQLPTSGKYYFEYTCTNTAGSNRRDVISVVDTSYAKTYPGGVTNSVIYLSFNGGVYLGPSGTLATTYSSWTNGDTVSCAIDCDTGKIWFAKNGTFNGSPSAGTSPATTLTNNGRLSFAVASDANSTLFSLSGTANFGQRPFAYTAPSGFKALCTANLPAPVVTKPNTVMDVALWTGNGTSQSITTDFSPDFVWIKDRSTTQNHALFDSVRGATNRLFSNLTNAEAAQSGSLTSFNSNGFSIGDGAAVNASAASYVGWTWDAGSSTVTNTAGSISSQVRANASAGFSIVTYTGNGTAGATVGHGLGVTPGMVIVKRRDSASSARWAVQHTSLNANQLIALNTTAAVHTESAGAGSTFNVTKASSTVITLGDYGDSNANIGTYVAYCFATVAGYSAFGSYTGNGSTDGPFVYTGFRPRWVMVKCSSSDQGGNAVWSLLDTARSQYNVAINRLQAQSSGAEVTDSQWMDINSNGFKIRETSSSVNANGATYIYAAFAESPFGLNNRAR